MMLESFACNFTAVTNLSPLQGMPLRSLMFHGTQVKDLSPLEGMPLREIRFSTGPVVSTRNLAILRRITTLEIINEKPAAEFWKKVEAGEVPKP
jgi:hypothetical protein